MLKNNIMGYKIGQKVWVKPVDAGDLEGIVKRFKKVEPYLPIIEFEYGGKTMSSAFSLNRINPHEEGKVEPVYIRVI